MKNFITSSYFFLFFLSAVWGSSFLFIKLSVDSINPSLLTFLRLFIASLFLIFYIKLLTNTKIFVKGNFKKILFIAVMGNVLPFNLIAWSETVVDSIIAAILIGTMPLFTFLISHFMKNGEKLNFKIFSGLLIGFLGMVLVLIQNSNIKSTNFDNFNESVLIIVASICYACSANCVKSIPLSSSIQIAASSTIVATLFSFIIYIILLNFSFSEKIYFISDINLKSLLSCIFLGVFCTGLASVIFFKLIKNESPGFASQSNFFIPIFGLIWSYLFLNELINIYIFFGLLLITLSLILVHLGRKKKF